MHKFDLEGVNINFFFNLDHVLCQKSIHGVHTQHTQQHTAMDFHGVDMELAMVFHTAHMLVTIKLSIFHIEILNKIFFCIYFL